MQPRILLLAIWAIPGFLVACQAPPKSKPSTTPPPRETSSGTEQTTTSTAPPPTTAPTAVTEEIKQVELLETGTGPFSDLRHQFKHDVTVERTLELQTAVGIVIVGQRFPLRPMPRMRLTVTTNMSSEKPFETAHLQCLVTSAEPINVDQYEPSVATLVQEQSKEISNLKVLFTINARGHVLESKVESDHNISASTHQLFDVLQRALHENIVIFPDKPVGKGSKWQVTKQISIGGLSVEQQTIYALQNKKKNQLDLTVNYKYLGKPQPMPLMSAPKGASAKLEKLSGEGTATQQLDTATWEFSSSSHALLEVDYIYHEKGADRAMGMRMNMDITTHPTTDTKP